MLMMSVTLVMLMVGNVFASATAVFSLFSSTKSSLISSIIPVGKISCKEREKKVLFYVRMDAIDALF